MFVEVKTRSSLAYGRPADAVNADKERLIILGAPLASVDYAVTHPVSSTPTYDVTAPGYSK